MSLHGTPTRWLRSDAALVVAGFALSGMAVVITADGSNATQPWLEATARALIVGVPIAVGVYARSRPASRRFGNLLAAAGVGWALTTLTEASDPVLHAVGRTAGWCVEPLLVYLVLSFPSGRLHTRIDKALVLSVTAVALVLYVGSVPFFERFPEPSPWGTCDPGCPANALMIAGSEPAVIEDLVRPLREVLIIVLFAAVAARLAYRLVRSTELTRRTLGPVLAIATLRFACFAGLVAARLISPDSAAVSAALWTLSLGIPLLALAFLLGLMRWRLFITAGNERLSAQVAGHPHIDDLQGVLAKTFDDPALRILYPTRGGGGWLDEEGRPVRRPPPGSDRYLTEVRDEGRVVAGIVHDASLRDEQAFIGATMAYVALTLDNRRLGVEAARLLAEVQESRLRIQTTADEERRRVERDLHDGAQQRLVALRIKIALAAEQLGEAEPAVAEVLRELGCEVDSALDEVRSLARGIYPSPLADRGLVEALRSAALQSSLPTTVLATMGRKRYPREVESATYFCCLEALQNAAKHAEGASAVVVELADNAFLRFEVRDDGAGFAPDDVRAGIGFTSMRDRIAAVGGTLALVSAPGRGTRVIGRIPLRATNEAPPPETALPAAGG